MDERNSSSFGTAAGSEPGGIGSTASATGTPQHAPTGSQASGIVGKVRERASAQLNTQKDRATDGLGSVAQAVRQTTQHLRERRHDTVAQYVEEAADQIERFSRSLKNKDVGELVSDAQRLARRQPALFVGGAFALGLVGARFFKSSPTIDRGAYGRYDYGGGYGTSGYQAAENWRGTREQGRADWRQPTSPGTGTSSSSGADYPETERF